MDNEQTHHAVSKDGTRIAGRVLGQGPPLVLISSALGDENTSWSAVAPLLGERFSCYLMATRGRGASGRHPDHTYTRLLEDVIEFSESIGTPVGLVGHSSAGVIALDVAARCERVSAVALYEPTLLEYADEEFATSIAEALEKVGSLAGQNRWVDAATTFFTDAVQVTDDELEALVRIGAPQRAADIMPVFLDELAQVGPPRLSDPKVLDDVTVPVLVLYGSGSHDYWRGAADQLGRRLARPDVRELDGVGHFAPLVAPAPVAAEFEKFFLAALQRA